MCEAVLEGDTSCKLIDLCTKLQVLVMRVIKVFDEKMSSQRLENIAKSPSYHAKTCDFTLMMQRSTADVWATEKQSIPMSNQSMGIIF
jgi:hypothetical protein